MKRRGRVCLTLCLFGSILLNSCGLIPGAGNKHPDFQTEYTIEEHIDRIRARTEENFSKEIQVGKIVNIEIEILYAFYDSDPEYFMVELEYAKEFAGEYTYRDDYWMETPVSYTTKYKHFIGFIENDKYYARVRAYTSYSDEPIDKFVDGRNPYALCGYDDLKKYANCQSYCAVQTDEGVLQIFTSPNSCRVEFDMDEKRFEQRIISEKEQKGLMKYPHFANFRYYLY